MRGRYINLERLKTLVPAWAVDVEALASEMDRHLMGWLGGSAIEPHKLLEFWVEVQNGQVRLAVVGDDSVDLRGYLIISGAANPLGCPCQIEVPLNAAIEGYAPLGSHNVYLHGIQTEVPLYYVGLTKQRWHARFSQHVSCSRAGSPYVFHRALAQHAGKQMVHKLLVDNLPFEAAMKYEEEFVNFSLYPKGMNMIPGGFAGIRYLASLGFPALNIKQRDAVIERLAKTPTVKGRPNPLCAARWQSDQEYVNRIICGHGARLTVEQVRQIRLLADFGRSPQEIARDTGAKNLRQVKGVLSSQRYGRVV